MTTYQHGSKMVLLAEDNEESAEMLSEYLETMNYHVVVAKHGEEAITFAREKQPDIILMDIQMPVMDGLEATRRLKADPELAAIPIVALTALAMRGDQKHCLEAGADAYVSKPVSLKKMVNIIESLLNP